MQGATPLMHSLITQIHSDKLFREPEDVEMASPSNACGSRRLSSGSSRRSVTSPGKMSQGSPNLHGTRQSMPRRSILKAPTPPPKRRSSLAVPWGGPRTGTNPKKSVRWPDTKSIGQRTLSLLSPLGSRLGLSCLRTPKPTFNDQLEEVHFISPKPSQDSDTPTPLWIKRHNLGAALLPGEQFDEDDEDDGAEPSRVTDDATGAWFCGQVERPSHEAMQSWLVDRENNIQDEMSFPVAEDVQDSPCSTDDYDQSLPDSQENPHMVVSVLQALPVEVSDIHQLDANKECRRSLKRWQSSAEIEVDSAVNGKENAAPPAKRARYSFDIDY